MNNLNAALANHPALAAKPADDLIRTLAGAAGGRCAGAVRNNGGGHANHSIFWAIMGAVTQRAHVLKCSSSAGPSAG